MSLILPPTPLTTPPHPTPPMPTTWLAIETSGAWLSLALMTPNQPLLTYEQQSNGADVSKTLLPQANVLLEQAHQTWQTIEGIAFGAGPGAFTGLRAAAAVTQGLAFAAQNPKQPEGLPVLPFSTLLAQAEASQKHLKQRSSWVLSVIDARMGQVYVALYQDHTDTPSPPTLDFAPWQTVLSPTVCQPESVWSMVETCLKRHLHHDVDVDVVDVVEDHHRLRLNWVGFDGLPPPPPPTPSFSVEVTHLACHPTAEAMLHLIASAWQSGQKVTAEQAIPYYIRNQVALTSAERRQKTMNP